jgi:hypothetical protein
MPVPPPHLPAVPDVAARILLACLQTTEPGSAVPALRDHLIHAPANSHRRHFTAADLDTTILLGSKYTGLPYIWAVLRQDPRYTLHLPVTAEQVWARLHQHLTHPDLAPSLAVAAPSTLTTEQRAAIAALIEDLEACLTDWVTTPPGVELLTTFTAADPGTTRAVLAGDRPVPGSPLLTALHPTRNPYPAWLTPGPGGFWLAAVTPISLYRVTVSHLTARNQPHTRDPLPATAITLSPQVHDTIATALALTWTANPSHARTFAGLNAAATAALTLLQPAARAHR